MTIITAKEEQRRSKRRRMLLAILLLLATLLAAFFVYVSTLYMRGGVSNYEPPPAPSISSPEKAQADLQDLAQAVDAYFIKNMEYPEKLESLHPEFLELMASDPVSGKPYLYTLDETEGAGRYRISVPDPKLYDAKEFYIEEGKIIKN